MRPPSFKKIAFLAIIACIFTFSLGTWAKDKLDKRESIYHDLDIFAKIIEKISSSYVEEVDTHKLIRDAIDAMLKDLDPHTQFLAGIDYEDLKVSTRGEFGGLGIIISFRDHYPTVISPIEGTPADRAGIIGGDQIVEIEGTACRDWRVEKAVQYLRGKPGTSVRFKISRPGLDEPIEYNITREVIKVSSVPYYGKFGDYGYIKVSNFARKTRREMQKALEEMESDGMKALIIDLRSNPGGLLQAATEVSELFLDKDKLIVYTKGRLINSNQKFYSENPRVHGGYPIVVMVDEYSASASEIFAGALQDWDLGFIIGRPTFGKGTVQTVISLSDSEALKLTTAKYYTPSGRCIHNDRKKGPHASAGQSEKDKKDVKGEEKKAEVEAKNEDKPVFTTASGRIVYGGGGITPDVEIEARHYSKFQRKLERDALFFWFAIEYANDHEVKKDFKVTDGIVEDFKEFMKKRKFEYTDEDLTEDNLNYIRVAILREITNKVFGRKAMYRVLLENDPEFKEVVSLLGKAPTLEALFSYAEAHKTTKKASLE